MLYAHKKTHLRTLLNDYHGDLSKKTSANQESRKTYECNVCGKRFKESGALNMHKISHLGEIS